MHKDQTFLGFIKRFFKLIESFLQYRNKICPHITRAIL